ncbi:MAG: hypothetical protein LAO76_27365 [Acidobacteriia bacterium]|nr:hypothetical protein [Terriglobia bacterium]
MGAIWAQIAPITPVLSRQAGYKSFAITKSPFSSFHGIEEVVGSILTTTI